MAENEPPSERSEILVHQQRAEIVDRLYDVALDPIRLEALVDLWEGHTGLGRQANGQSLEPMDDPELDVHLKRASIFLDRYEATRVDGVFRSILEDIPRSAAFLADENAGIVSFNRPAAVAFGLRDGAVMADLPFEPEDIETLRSMIYRVASGRAERVVTLRIRSSITGSPVIVRIGPVEGEAERPLALVMSTELVWPEGFEDTVQEAFGLTSAEVEIVRGIALGLPVKDIAEARGRSQETVRTQMRSILSKTETHSQSELLRVVLGLMDVASISTDSVVAVAQTGGLEPLAFQEMTTHDGRTLEWIEFGAPNGRPVLYMHLDFGLIRWPASAERAARQRRLRVIVPIRAGYGRTHPHRRSKDHLEGVTEDYLSVLEFLNIRRCAVIAMGADLRFALNLSLMRPELVTGIIGCSAQLPLRTAAQYDRMDKWQRFILANARYAPKVLPFLVKAGFSLARRLGKEKFFAQVNGGSAADLEAFARPEVREAVLVGSEVSLSAKLSAHEAFTRECIGSEQDWSRLVLVSQVRVLLLQGDQDPQTPVLTVKELMVDFPHLEVRFLPNTGQLLFFAEWATVLDTLEQFLP